jgi:hypothetical protein
LRAEAPGRTPPAPVLGQRYLGTSGKYKEKVRASLGSHWAVVNSEFHRNLLLVTMSGNEQSGAQSDKHLSLAPRHDSAGAIFQPRTAPSSRTALSQVFSVLDPPNRKYCSIHITVAELAVVTADHSVEVTKRKLRTGNEEALLNHPNPHQRAAIRIHRYSYLSGTVMTLMVAADETPCQNPPSGRRPVSQNGRTISLQGG